MKYFSIEELIASSTANRHGIDNTPDVGHVGNLHRLVGFILDPLREEYCAPIVVNSGYRCPKLNKLVGGVKNSAHCDGRAADIRSLDCSPCNNQKIGEILESHINEWPIDELIYENCTGDGFPSWIHVAFSRSPRRKILHT